MTEREDNIDLRLKRRVPASRDTHQVGDVWRGWAAKT